MSKEPLASVSSSVTLPFVQYESSQRVHYTAVYLLETVHIDRVVASTVLLSNKRLNELYLLERTGNCCCCWAMSWSNSSGTFYPGQAYPSKAGKGSGAESYLITIMVALWPLSLPWSENVHEMLAYMPSTISEISDPWKPSVRCVYNHYPSPATIS